MNTTIDTNSIRGCLGSSNKRNLLQFIRVSTDVIADSLVQYYLDYSDKLIKNEGELSAVKKLKQLYGVALRHAAGVSYEPQPYLRSYKDGFPKVLKPFRKILEGSPNAKRASLTVLQLFKLKIAEDDFSTESITKPYTGLSSPEWLDAFDEVVEQEFPSSQLSKRKAKLSGDFLHISGKNGPNGPASLEVLVDYKAIKDAGLKDRIFRLSCLTGNLALTQIMQKVERCVKPSTTFKHKKDRKPEHSRLRIKYEPGGKARVFCILDFYSQSALKPIHNYLMDWLKTQPTDGTADHSVAARQLSEWTSHGEKLWSFDLTTATDRYPVFLQKRVMSRIFGQQIADLWFEIIADRSFLDPNCRDRVRFSVGQPLGALSSWAAFAVTHHLHIRTAARLAINERQFKNYRIIGDDICIYKDYRVALRYIGMMRDLDVPFSTEKSITPPQCKHGSAGELAKRVFLNGSEITPIPPDEILIGMSNPFGKRILIESSLGRGYSTFESPYSVQSLLKGHQEWAAMTFPVGRSLPLSKGVKVILSGWDYASEESPPGGLNPGWAYWETGLTVFPEGGFEAIVAQKLRNEISSGIMEARKFVFRSNPYNKFEGFQYKGGDWQPGLQTEPEVVRHILDYFGKQLGETLKLIDKMISREDLDLYRLIARVNTVPTLRDLLGRQKFLDEKTNTKLACSLIVKDAIKLRRSPLEDFWRYVSRYQEY